MDANVILLPGDGIGPEIVAQAELVLAEVAERFGHKFHMSRHAIGGCAIDEFGSALPDETLQACRESDAILLPSLIPL